MVRKVFGPVAIGLNSNKQMCGELWWLESHESLREHLCTARGFLRGGNRRETLLSWMPVFNAHIYSNHSAVGLYASTGRGLKIDVFTSSHITLQFHLYSNLSVGFSENW